MKKLILSLPIFFSLLGAWSSASAADIHFICNVKVFNTSDVTGQYAGNGKADVYIQGDLIKITGNSGYSMQHITIYLKDTVDEWGIEHQVTYNYNMPASFSGHRSWDIGNMSKNHRGGNPYKWMKTATSFSLDEARGELRYRNHMFTMGHFIQNLEGTCKDVNKESPNSMRNFLDFFRF